MILLVTDMEVTEYGLKIGYSDWPNIQMNRIFPNLLKKSNPEMKPNNPKQYKYTDIDVSNRGASVI